MGRIGQAACRARAFACRSYGVHVCRPTSKGATYAVRRHAALLRFPVDLAPMTPATASGECRAHRQLPKGAVVVNTARGGVVDDDALIAALKSGRIFPGL
jgi:glyoxylate reductase